MLDIKLIRERADLVKKNLKKRGNPGYLKWVDNLIEVDKKWRFGLKEIEGLRHKRNILTQEIAVAKKAGGKALDKIKEVKDIPDKIKKLEDMNELHKEKINHYLMRLPNLLHDSVPIGRDENDNKIIRTHGKPPNFKFKPRNHLELLEHLKLIDAGRAARVSGTGFFYFIQELALLDFALMKYAMDFMLKKGYTLVEPPFMLRKKPYEGVTDLDDFESVMYGVEGSDLYLIATSEHPIAAMFQDEVLLKEKLPLKMIGVSPCFRREIGAHGKYTKGLFRMHQFNKIEQFIFSLPEESWKYHEELQRNAEELYKKLGLTYKVANVCTGDIGTVAAKKYDINLWMADKKYREAGSNSNCTDYQARRLNIRFKEKEGQPVKGFVHTLNSTAIATSRVMVAILEQFQQSDGSVKIPGVLVTYMNGIKKLEK